MKQNLVGLRIKHSNNQHLTKIYQQLMTIHNPLLLQKVTFFYEDQKHDPLNS